MQAYVFNTNSEPTPAIKGFDDTTDITTSTFLDVLLHGDTSDLTDRFYPETSSSKLILMDVRSPQEVQECPEMAQFVPNSGTRVINVPSGQLLHMNKKALERNYGIKEEDTVVCFCAGGARSAQGVKKLRALGFDCFNLYGGLKSLAGNYAKKTVRKLVRA